MLCVCDEIELLGGLSADMSGSSIVDFYTFLYEALPEEGELTLEELHAVIRNVWLTRHDQELQEEQAARRKGRPKSAKEIKLEDLKLQESEGYRTGLGASDRLLPLFRSALLHHARLPFRISPPPSRRRLTLHCRSDRPHAPDQCQSVQEVGPEGGRLH